MKRLIPFLVLISSTAFALNPYSNSELDTLEKEFVEQINQSNQLVRTPLATQYINQIGQRLSAHALHPAPTFFIVNSNEINAFAGPGGYIGINTALILATTSEDELAAVMAHELAHVKLHHLYDMIEHQKLMRFPTLASMLAAAALGVINPTLGSGAMLATLSGAAQNSINYTRSHEKEADRIGMQLLTQAGFRPQAMAHFFKKLQESTRYYDTANIPALLQTHPLDDERIAEAENRTPVLTMQAAPNPLEFELFKAIIRTTMASSPKVLFDYYAKQPRTPANNYGLLLTYLNSNHFNEANTHLTPLLEHDPNNLFFIITKSQIDLGLQHPEQAITLLQTFHQRLPDNYPLTFALGESLLQANQPHAAATLLTKAFRRYPRNLALCQILAEAEAAQKRQNYAYFIESTCEHLQGHELKALQRLKTAKTLTNRDSYLEARIEARMEEIRSLKPFQ